MSVDKSRFFSITSTTPSHSKKKITWTRDETLQLAKDLLDKCLSSSSTTTAGGGGGNFGSLYTGFLGPSVYLRLQLANHLSNNTNKDEQQQQQQQRISLLQEAKKDVEYAIKKQERTSSSSSSSKQQRVSLLEGKWVGAKCLLAAIMYKLNEHSIARKHSEHVLKKLTSLCSEKYLHRSECEVLYGRAGALQAVWFLRQQLNDPSLGRDFVIVTSESILHEGLKTAKKRRKEIASSSSSKIKLPLLWEWHDKVYLGAAHGIVGILQTLLYLTTEEWEILECNIPSIKKIVRDTIDSLNGLCYPSGNLRSSLESRGGDRLVHWCHGVPGYCLLLIKAADVYNNDKYLIHAKELAINVLWPRGLLKKGVGICHGISGNAYVFLTLARQDGINNNNNNNNNKDDTTTTTATTNTTDNDWQQKAMVYAQFAVDNLNILELVPDRPYSLYEGLGGLISILLDLHNPIDARFPLYEY